MPFTLYERKCNRCDRCQFGGRAFEIRGKQFCSPFCGNKYFDLHYGDEDYWDSDEEESEYATEDEEEESETEEEIFEGESDDENPFPKCDKCGYWHLNCVGCMEFKMEFQKLLSINNEVV